MWMQAEPATGMIVPSAIQRFCPVCDVAFARADSLVQCEGCGVLYHPACWHRTGRCITAAEHLGRPVARAYGLEPPPDGALDEIVGAHVPASVTPPLPAAPRPRHDPPYDSPRAIAAPGPSRTVDPMRAPMPRVYGHRRWLRYWYVPVAAALSAVTAYAVVLAVDAVVGDEPASTIEPAASTTVISQTPLPTPAASASNASSTPAAASGNATPGAGSLFEAGQKVTVTGTGECLNVRADASTDAPVIDCLPDGSVLTIVDGPREAAGRAWWHVNIGAANGWAAEEYLRAR